MSAKSEVEDKIKGINMGANDYLAKPFNFDELVARINGLLRREFIQHNELVKLGEYCLDSKNQKLEYKNKEINLSKKEYEMIYYLFINQNRCLSSEEIIDHIWKYEDGNSEKLKVLINKLRKKIPTSIIKNKWGVGYYVDEK